MDEGKRQPSSAVGEDDKPLEDRDLVFVQGRDDEGDSFRVIRSRTGQIEVGELRPLKAGQAIHGEVVSLSPVEGHEQLFDVDVLVAQPEQSRGRVGPAKVASKAYRKNWDSIFGGGGSGALN